jgi:hypothetical protein
MMNVTHDYQISSTPQLDGEHTFVSSSSHNILQENENKSKLCPHIQNIIPQLSSYSGEFDHKAYVNWEMEVDKEFRNLNYQKSKR